MAEGTTLWWVRKELRLSDNPALCKAATTNKLLPVFVLRQDWLEGEQYGIQRFSAKRLKFLLEALTNLKRALRERGSGLLFRVGDPAVILPEIAEQHNVSRVVATSEVADEEVRTEQQLKLALPNTELALVSGNWLYEPAGWPFAKETVPKVFTQFRKALEKNATVAEPLPVPDELPPLPDTVSDEPLPAMEDLGFTPPKPDERAFIDFTGGETAGKARLSHYFWETRQLKRYKQTRNGLLGADYSSKFSPWLAWGCLSPRSVYQEVKQFEETVTRNKSTYWLCFELIWRDFFRAVTWKAGPKLFYSTGIEGIQLSIHNPPGFFERWCQGQTGVPFVDANMRELAATGYMSNRGRQNVASYLVKDLQVDWRWGAAWFEQHLLDYDPASNWGNWNYVAGVGNDPRKRRYFNIMSQASRYDKKCKYIRHWVPEIRPLEDFRAQHPWTLYPKEQQAIGLRLGTHYPEPLAVGKHWDRYYL